LLNIAWKLFFLTSWGRFQRRFDNILEDLTKHEEQIDKEANIYNIAEARNMRQNLEAWRQESLAQITRDEEEQTTSQLQAVCSWLKRNESDQLLIFDNISAQGSKHPGTCSWVLKHPAILSWLQNESDIPFIWLQGNPGTGKSIIAGQLITFLNASEKSLVVSHFCTYSYISSTQYEEILKSLLFQLVHVNSDLVAHLYGRYVVDKKSASVLVLEQLLQTVITALLEDLGQGQSIYMIIDGLDQVDTEKQRQLVNLMDRFLKGQQLRGAACKVLVSCRTSHLLKRILRKKATVSLSDEKNNLNHPIRTYAEQKLKAQRYRLSQLGLQDRDLADIGQSIATKSDGTYCMIMKTLWCC
jgi:hypothetical protein